MLLQNYNDVNVKLYFLRKINVIYIIIIIIL